MDCTAIHSVLDTVVIVTRVWQVFLCLVFAIIIGICITIIIIACWYKVCEKGKKCKVFCCCCCVAVGALLASKKKMRKSSSTQSGMMLTAWENEASNSEDDSDAGSESVATTVLVESRKVLIQRNSVEEIGSDTESTVGVRFNVPLIEKPLKKNRMSLAEILTQRDQEAKNTMMYEYEKNTILKIEEEFIRQKSDLFLFMLDCVATQIVASGQAEEDWKLSLRDYCENVLLRTKKRTRNHSVVNLGNFLPQMPETFQINMNGVITTLLEHVQRSIDDDTKVGEMEADGIVSELQANWSAFEKTHSDIYLRQIKAFRHHFQQKAQIVEVIDQESKELMNEMIQHVELHTNALRRLQIKDPFINMHRAEDRLAPELEEIWHSAIDQFKMDLQTQKIQLSMEVREELLTERKKNETNYEQEIQEIQEAILNEDGSIEDYVEKYCDMIQSTIKEQLRLEELETQLTANGFSSLTEAVGNKYLKMGLRGEGELYTNYIERTHWIEPKLSQTFSEHQRNLADLQLNLKDLRKMQRKRLQDKINEHKEDVEARSESDVIEGHKSIQEVIELQADLSEMECQQLLDQCTAQQKSFEAQLALNQLKQERRLEQRLRQERDHICQSLNQVNKSSANPETKLKATFQHKQEEKDLYESHQQSLEELKTKMREEIEASKKGQELFFQQRIEHLRRGHERRLLLASKQDEAIKSLKNKLLNRLENGAEKAIGERIIKEHQITKDVLKETIQQNKLYHQQVLQQKLQARRLDKKQEKEKDFKREAHVEPYRPGSAKRFAADALVSLLLQVKHKRAVKSMEEQMTGEGERVKTQIERKFKIHSKLELQLREAEMIANLATTLGMTRAELELELKKSVEEQGHSCDSEYGILLSKSVLQLFESSDGT